MAEPKQDKQVPPPQRVGVREFRGNLSGFLRQARQGSTFLVMSHDQVLAEVRPPPRAERPRRRPGALRGKIRIAPDFDTLPTDVLATMEGEEE
jgi:antitoxin (DNA-binding transcriptional repressor) of toxin-antitoxin stability system